MTGLTCFNDYHFCFCFRPLINYHFSQWVITIIHQIYNLIKPNKNLIKMGLPAKNARGCGKIKNFYDAFKSSKSLQQDLSRKFLGFFEVAFRPWYFRTKK